MTMIHLKNPLAIAAAAAALLWTAGVTAYGALHENWSLFHYIVAPPLFLTIAALFAGMAIAACGFVWLMIAEMREMVGEIRPASSAGRGAPVSPHGGDAPRRPWRRPKFHVVDGGVE